MFVRLLMAACGLAILLANSSSLAAAEKEQVKGFDGVWTVESAKFDGKAPPEEIREVIFAGEKMTMKAAEGKSKDMLFRLDATQKPATIDFKFAGEAPKNASLGTGIYDLDGDKLRICIGPPDKRPSEFSGAGTMLIVLKRQKP